MRVILIWILAAVWANAQVVPGRYVVELSGDGAAALLLGEGVRQPGRSAALASRRAAVRQGQADVRRQAAALGATVLDSLDTVSNALLVAIPDAQAAALQSLPGVLRVHPVRRIFPKLNRALEVHGIPEAWNLAPQGREGAGAGIKIGIIDSGIDAGHPGFAEALPALPGFPKVTQETDLAYTNAKIVVARNYTTLLGGSGERDAGDHDGHGTGTAMVAAGGQASSPYGLLSGVAPKAYLGNYKVLAGGGTTSDLIAKAIDDAVADGMDVINLSLGSIVMSYSDLDPARWIDIAALDAAARAGVIVVVAAGNEGPGATTISEYGSLSSVITAGAIRNKRYLADAVQALGNTYPALPGDVADPDATVSGILFDVTALDPTGLACASLPAGSAAGTVLVILRGTCTFTTKIANAAAAGAAAVIIYNNRDGAAFHHGSQTISGALPTLFMTNSDGLALLAGSADAADRAATLDFRGTSEFATPTTLVDFSSRGPALGSALKPDLVAVGSEIVTAAQSHYPSGESYSPDGFLDTAGTSFSSPLAAGAAAVLRGARPGLSTDQYRSLLIHSARTAAREDGSPAAVSQAGAGTMNLAAAVSGTLAAYPLALNFGTGSGTVEKSLNLKLSNLGAAGDTFSLEVAALAGPAPAVSTSTLSLDGGASTDLSLSLGASDMPPGEYSGFVQVTSATNSTTARIPYWFAVPGAAPSGISLLYQEYEIASGRTASYAVVFRIVDQAGLPFSGSAPTVTVASGSGSVRSVYRSGTVPGTYAVDVRAGNTAMQLSIRAGDITGTVYIGVY